MLKKIRSLLRKSIIFPALFICQSFFCQTPTWTAVTGQAPDHSGGLMLLLSDGSVMCKTNNGGGDGTGNMWDKLSPDSHGSYINGTWSTMASMSDTRLYFSSQITKDGRIYVSGGEYGTGGSKSEIYDPVSNSWTPLSNPNGYVGDANSVILENGNILQATLVSPLNKTLIFNPHTNTYSNGPSTLGGHDESSWLKLPDNSILFVNINSTSSERYIPSLNQWTVDATVPTNLYDPYGSETGPAFLLPNGKAIYFGSLGNTAIYTPSGNNSPGSWVTGPTIPGGNGMPDATGAMMVDGKILITASPVPTATNAVFHSPTHFYEYDYVTNTFTTVVAPGGGQTISGASYVSNMLNLPDGNILFSSQGSRTYYVRAADGPPLAVGKPTITACTQNGCTNTFSLTGMLFNGISAGSCYGDDWQMNTNFPIVRLTSGSNVYYARTYNWNSTGQQRGTLADTTLFSLNANIPNGTYSLCVIANGISSDPITFTFTPFPALTSPSSLPDICSGNSFSYNAVANTPGATVLWTRAAVAGITNAAITTPQTANPNEVLTNTASVAKTAVYSYTVTNGGCTTYDQVSIVVNPIESIAVTGNTNVCAGTQVTLSATGINTFSWSVGIVSNSITPTPLATTVYTASGYNSFGCFCVRQVTVIARALPTLTITGPTTICTGDSVVLTASGTGTYNVWNGGVVSKTLSIQPTSSTSYTVISYTNGCHVADSVDIVVEACTGIKENRPDNLAAIIYPNPSHGNLFIECTSSGGFASMVIEDIQGKPVRTYAIDPSEKVVEIKDLDLSPGIYFCRFFMAGKILPPRKLVIAN